MKKLFAALASAPKRTAGLLTMLAAAVIVPSVLWAWGPERPTYTYAKPAPHVTFNSIVDNPSVGDERNFVRIREVANGTNFRDDVSLQAGKTYEVMVFYHNNAASNLNESGKGIAKDVTARVQMPGRLAAGETATITGFISASNATPQTVWDNARATTSDAVALRYVPGSAKIASSNGAVNGSALSSNLLTSGVKLGYNKLDGTLPGCNEYSGYITYRFVVDKPDFTLDKQVSVDGGKTWAESAKTTPGSTIQYRLIYKNTGTVQQDNVILKDELPAGVTYVPGSSQIANATTGGAYKSTVDGITGSGGYKIGSFTPGSNNYFKFSAKVGANSTLAKCGDNKLTNKVIAYTENGSKSDTADVTVPKDCPPTPKYTCDSLTVKKLERTKFEFTTAYTVENATFKHVTYVVKNAAGTEVYRGQNRVFTTETVGTYTVEAFVTVTVNGADKTVTSAKCKGTFEVTKKPVEPKPGVTITKKVDGEDRKTVAINQEFTYQLTVKNTGNVTLTNVKVTDAAPAGVQFISADKGVIANNAWSYTIPELKVGESINFAIKAKATKSNLTGIKNTACVDAPQVPGTPDDCDDATIVVPPTPVPGVKIDKKVDGVEHKKVTVNQEFTYQIVVRNTGTVDLKDVKVSDNAPANVQFISANAGTIVDNKWNHVIPELKVGQSVSFAIKAKVTKEVEGVITNTACVDAPQVPGTPDDCDDATVEVPKTPTPPVDEDIKVCNLETKTIITIKQSEFDATKHTEDLSKCAEAPTPEVPTELPTTGLSEGIMAFVGLGSLALSVTYYAISRRSLGNL